jgi:hypothetical protein
MTKFGYDKIENSVYFNNLAYKIDLNSRADYSWKSQNILFFLHLYQNGLVQKILKDRVDDKYEKNNIASNTH